MLHNANSLNEQELSHQADDGRGLGLDIEKPSAPAEIPSEQPNPAHSEEDRLAGLSFTSLDQELETAYEKLNKETKEDGSVTVTLRKDNLEDKANLAAYTKLRAAVRARKEEIAKENERIASLSTVTLEKEYNAAYDKLIIVDKAAIVRADHKEEDQLNQENFERLREAFRTRQAVIQVERARLNDLSMQDLNKELDDAFEKVNFDKNEDGSLKRRKEDDSLDVTIRKDHAEEDRLNLEKYLSIKAVANARDKQQELKIEPGTCTKVGAALGTLLSVGRSGIGITNDHIFDYASTAATAASVGFVADVLPKVGFFSRRCATVGASLSMLKFGFGVGPAAFGAMYGLMNGLATERLGVWGKAGIVAGVMGGLITGGLALEAILLGTAVGISAASTVKTFVEYRKVCGQRP